MLEEKKEFDGNTPITEENLEEALNCQVVEEEKATENETEKENVESKDPLDVKDAVLAHLKEELINQTGMNEDEANAALQMLEEAQMPVKLSDADFKCGPQELDIRYLSKKNVTQYFFRTLLLNGVYLRNISKSLLDVTNLLFVIIDALGVKDIIKASDEVISKVAKEHEKRQKEEQEKQNQHQEEPKEEPKN